MRLLLAATLVVGLTPAASIAQIPRTEPSWRAPAKTARRVPDLARLDTWLALVAEHQPGSHDRAVVEVASWSRTEIEGVLFDFTALRSVLITPDRLQFPSVTRPPTMMEWDEMRRLVTREAERWLNHPVRLVDVGPSAAARTRIANRLIKRGALLHTDIAVGGPSEADRDASAGPGLIFPVRQNLLVADGRQEGVSNGSTHWDVARWLLDHVGPSPSRDGVVRDWYLSVATMFASRRLIAEASPHLEQARRLFPADAEILTASGQLYEAQASPRIQNFVQGAELRGVKTSIGSERANLRRAEELLRRAVALDPHATDAQVRLGRVLGRMGRHQEAADQLRKAEEEAPDALNRFYATLCLGAEEAALGHLDRARESFERAAALSPTAQSPNLALSQLARRTGDRAGAVRAIERVLALPRDERERPDPIWWYYDEPRGREDARMAASRAALFLTA